MFYETSHEKLFFTERWPISTNTVKINFSKSLNSLGNKKMKSITNLSSANSLSSSLTSSQSSSLSNSSIYNSNNLIETINNSYIFTSQESILDIIEEEEL